MAPARTLFEIAGRPGWTRPAAGEAAVVIIDAQREYLDGPLALTGVGAAVEELVALRRRAAEAGWPVVHIRHRGRAGSLFDLDAPRGTFIAGLEPTGDEPVVDKTLADGFAGTDFGPTLARLGVRRLVVTGFMTHNCVSSTARRAVSEGYAVAVVASATATRDLPAAGGVIAATDLQRATLAGLGDAQAIILPSVAAL